MKSIQNLLNQSLIIIYSRRTTALESNTGGENHTTKGTGSRFGFHDTARGTANAQHSFFRRGPCHPQDRRPTAIRPHLATVDARMGWLYLVESSGASMVVVVVAVVRFRVAGTQTDGR